MTDSSGTPEGVRVLLSQSGAGGLLHQATTDENGEFRFDDLRDGVYTVVGVLARGYFMSRPANGIHAVLYYLGYSINIELVKGGVITGKVLGTRGEPLVGVSVRAVRTRDLEGLPPMGNSETTAQTDDRGIYRLYGLTPGMYVVAAGGASRDLRVDPSGYDPPTYYPSETRATAKEISIQAGTETGNIDIRYRGEEGHSISGAVIGLRSLEPNFISVTLLDSGLDTLAAFTNPFSNSANQAFLLLGVGDGDYELLVRGNSSSGSGFIGMQHVTVRGADVANLKISPSLLGSVTGQIRVDSRVRVREGDNCKVGNTIIPETVLLIAKRSDASQSKPFHRMLSNTISSSPNEKGQFAFSNLAEGTYHIEARLPNDGFYVAAMTLPTTPSNTPQTGLSKTIDVGRNGFTVKPGENLNDLNLTLAYGAASLKGRMTIDMKAAIVQRVSLNLVPAEREFEDDPLHYAEVPVLADGSFVVSNLPPGRYWMVARRIFDGETKSVTNALAWDPKERARLRDEGRLGGRQVEFRPCQSVRDYVLLLPTALTLSNQRTREN